MLISARSRLRSASTVAVVALAVGFLGACASSQPKAMVNIKKRSKEYFSESEYGVKASPRVSNQRSNLARGGGRDQLGKPYKVRGKVYYPKEDKNYKKVGLASWYGDAFHGRLTANGEVYDMTHLTAAHPTMPLPSYARVTNTENGNSVIVRVNDRGPYSHDRLIDLSSKAADLLDYKRIGTARVKVEYVGRAPLDGHDDQYLMASYRPGNRAPDPSDGLPEGVMIAMNGPTPTTDIGAAPFESMVEGTPVAFSGIALPTYGPIAPERPSPDDIGEARIAMASLSYADDGRANSRSAFAALEGHGLTATAVIQSWKRMNDATVQPVAAEPYVAAGSFTVAEDADRLAGVLKRFGKIEVEKSDVGGTLWYSVNLRADGRASIDDLLQAAWDNGATDAMTIRD